MQVFINEQEIGAIPADGSTVGEVIEALHVHVPVDHVVTAVDIDGEAFQGGDEGYARRPSRSVGRLHLHTRGPEALARDFLVEVGGGLAVVTAKVERATEQFRRGDTRAALRLLAELIEELHLVIVLEQRVATLAGGAPRLATPPFERVGERLIESQERGRTDETARLLDEELRPLLTQALERILVAARQESDGLTPARNARGDA